LITVELDLCVILSSVFSSVIYTYFTIRNAIEFWYRVPRLCLTSYNFHLIGIIFLVGFFRTFYKKETGLFLEWLSTAPDLMFHSLIRTREMKNKRKLFWIADNFLNIKICNYNKGCSIFVYFSGFFFSSNLKYCFFFLLVMAKLAYPLKHTRVHRLSSDFDHIFCQKTRFFLNFKKWNL
jgi:hypothetical protein